MQSKKDSLYNSLKDVNAKLQEISDNSIDWSGQRCFASFNLLKGNASRMPDGKRLFASNISRFRSEKESSSSSESELKSETESDLYNNNDLLLSKRLDNVIWSSLALSLMPKKLIIFCL